MLDLAEMERISLDSVFLPKPDMFPVEALLATHFQTASHAAPCDARVCIAAHSAPANLPGRPDDTRLVRLDLLASPVAQLPDGPIELVLVIDRSGSMEDGKLEQMKRGLLTALPALRDSDRLAVVAFGESSELLVPLGEVGGRREKIVDAISSLEPSGLTNLEDGLDLGFRTAMKGAATPGQDRRLLLITDQWPNLDPAMQDGLIDLARAGAAQSVGLSTVGVHQTFDNVLAMRLSAIPGGRFLDWAEGEDGAALLAKNFASLVSDPARNVQLHFGPDAGQRVTALYGVPEELVSVEDNGRVSIALGGGFVEAGDRGIYASIAGPDEGDAGGMAGLDVNLTATREDGAEFSVAPQLSTDMAKGQMGEAQAIIDTHLTVTGALETYHTGGDIAEARQELERLQERMRTPPYGSLDDERQIVAAIERKLRAIEENTGSLALLEAIAGRWEVLSQKGLAGARKGDLLELTRERELLITRRSGPGMDATSRQTFQITGDRLLVDDTDLFFRIEAKGDRLTLHDELEGDRLRLKRLP
ncbi:von Willebrand factor type A domain-containing protein [Altererythrobacter xiamenensis]|uniref:von Willebrand factor type A domain-containing protein n=1 Tax=Altererythrobacter xiamenensis TaxID=1316679 RepID=A0A1Y6FLI3_9SPHN|nr:VWA domain-containing protein [Altererythrobacter xiamenensis]SMQ74371.1 von Willebrand factor type A domain-containing protein [Altererythrobacter xiamenensis]